MIIIRILEPVLSVLVFENHKIIKVFNERLEITKFFNEVIQFAMYDAKLDP